MHIIDEMQDAIRRKQVMSKHPLPLAELDPVVFVSEHGNVWTLGMVIPMWEAVFRYSADEVSQRGIPF